MARINDALLREMILNEDFKTAYYLVCKYITKRELQGLHMKIIAQQSSYMNTLHLAPRGFGKSTVGDVDFCITKILRDGNIRIMIGSKTQTQAEAFLKEIRTHFEMNDDLIRVFGDLKGSKWTDKEFVVNTRTTIKKEATVTALGASGAVVSKHFDIIIGDDLVGFENARTETQRTKLREWFYSSLAPTLEPHGEMHLLGTRYHPLDLYQDFINSGNYNVVIQKSLNVYDGSKSFKAWKKCGYISEDIDIGEEFSLWESKFDKKTLLKKKSESGSIIFAMQYQNDVELAKGSIFKSKYFKYYDGYEIDYKRNKAYVNVVENGQKMIREVKVYFGVDLAISQKETADYFVIAVVGVDKNYNFYLLDYVKERLSFDAQMNKIIKYGESKFPMVERVGVEAVAYQMAMVQELRRSSSLPIIALKTTTDKISRAMRRSALFENGKIFFKTDMLDMEECLLLFPEVEHDDLFDGLEFAVTVAEQSKNIRAVSRDGFYI